MPKKSKKNSPVKKSGTVLPELEFSEREMKRLAKKCRDAIAAILDSRHIGFDQYQSVGDRVVYQLSGASVTKAEAKYTYNVIPLFIAPSGLYWLAASLEFIYRQGKYTLEGVSLLVFEGQAFDEKKSALLRAEWVSLQEDALAPHAQPHWHIYPSRINRSLDSRQAKFEPEPAVVDFNPNEPILDKEGPSEWDRGERFHFAMASRWHLDGQDASCQEALHPEKLLNWVAGCLKYTRSQLEFLYKS